ncbi:MAG TPA: hypothetical protein PLZ58_04085 [Candidatus Saccharibacteria bacterium]|nr:hypothetical protein [Candidatus Saccharibacteria bacterium]
MSMIIAPTVATFKFVGGLFGLLFNTKPPKIGAQTLGELSSQTAKEGEPRPIVYGIGRPIGGNIMYMSPPIRKMVKTYVGEAGGKGGSKKKKQYQDVEHVYRYYAIRVCEGPITGYRRIWRNGALVYDGRKGSAWGAKNNHLFFNTYRLYTGSWNQMPDSVLQARQGMDIPAYRGTAYLVANNEDLTDFGGAVPQWQFEVARSEGYYLTSRPYAVQEFEHAGRFGVGGVGVDLKSIYNESGMQESLSGFGVANVGVELKNAFNEIALHESVSGFTLSGFGVELKNAFNETALHESVSGFGVAAVGVEVKEVLINHELDAESVSAFIVSGVAVNIS